MFTEIRIGTQLVETFFDLTIEQNFNAHHRFSFYIPNSKEDNGITLIKEGIFNHIGKEITIKWGVNRNEKAVIFNGLITEVKTSTKDAEESRLFIIGHDNSYAFSDFPKTRTFFDKNQKDQKQTLESVVKDVVKDAGVDLYCKVDCKIAHNLKLPYVVQYKENVFDFLNRLAIRYGEWFYVDGKTLHFGNAKVSNTHELLLGANLFNLDYELNIHPVGDGVVGYNHQLGDMFTGTSSKKNMGNTLDKLDKTQKNMFVKQSSEYLSWQPGSSDEVNKQGEYHYQEQLGCSFSLKGQSDKCDIKLGDVLKFKVDNPSENNSKDNLNECRVVAITHHMSGTKTNEYKNTFRAIDKKLDYIPVDPNSVPKPYNAEPEYAEVISNEDANGRVQVAFFWNNDREHNRSFFMPCLSPYSGGSGQSNRGILFIPEVGDIVLVGYYKGDPSQPFVMGGVQNSKTAKVKEDNKNNDIKSITTRSGHVIEFNDKQDAESITITDKEKNSIKMNKDGIEVKANNEKNIILMNDKGIKIIDDSNKNSIEMSNSGIVLNSQRDVKINAQNIKLEAQIEVEQKGGSGTIKVGGAGVDIQAPSVKIS